MRHDVVHVPLGSHGIVQGFRLLRVLLSLISILSTFLVTRVMTPLVTRVASNILGRIGT